METTKLHIAILYKTPIIRTFVKSKFLACKFNKNPIKNSIKVLLISLIHVYLSNFASGFVDKCIDIPLINKNAGNIKSAVDNPSHFRVINFF